MIYTCMGLGFIQCQNSLYWWVVMNSHHFGYNWIDSKTPICTLVEVQAVKRSNVFLPSVLHITLFCVDTLHRSPGAKLSQTQNTNRKHHKWWSDYAAMCTTNDVFVYRIGYLYPDLEKNKKSLIRETSSGYFIFWTKMNVWQLSLVKIIEN